MRLLTSFLLTAWIAFAADITGAWNGTTRLSLNGKVEEDTMYFSLKQVDNLITGTAGPSVKDQAPIKNGKVEGQRITFDLPVPNGVFHFDLNLEGERLKGTLMAEAQGQHFQATLEAVRAK